MTNGTTASHRLESGLVRRAWRGTSALSKRCAFGSVCKLAVCVTTNAVQVPGRLSNAIQRLIEIGDYIISIFEPNRDSYQTVGDSQARAFVDVN
jgi:hypothetical protein